MSRMKHGHKVTLIEIDRIHILNPRVRNKKVFGAIKENIAQVGLKRPITVTLSHAKLAGKDYDLVCGQGRLEAFMDYGEKHIPAIIIDASEEDALIMSLVENFARCLHKATDLLQAVEILKTQNYSTQDIARKVGMSADYIADILRLLERGEERLISAVESGQMPMTIAIKIAATGDDEMQSMLRELYETKQLRGRKLLETQQLIEKRLQRGKAMKRGGRNLASGKMNSADDILRVYKKEADRKRMLTRKAMAVNGHLLFVTEALKQLFKEEHFTTLLRAEGLVTLPKPLSLMVHGKE